MSAALITRSTLEKQRSLGEAIVQRSAYEMMR